MSPKLSVPKQRAASIRRHGLRATLSCGPTGQIAASLVMHRRGHKLLVVGRARRIFAVTGTTKLVVRPHAASVALSRVTARSCSR